jgi:tetratricopeptide (TPR) repeat protein
VHEQYADLDERWKHFNRVYLVVYRPDDEWRVRDILGTAWDEAQNAQEALARAQQEAQLNPNDIFAWFNVGSSYVLLQQWQAAATAYDRARSTGKGLPWRMLWYQFGPYKAYYKVGDYKTMIELANAVIAQTRYVEETFYYRGLAYAATGVPDQAMADLQYAANFNPNFNPALTAIAQLQAGVKPVPETL